MTISPERLAAIEQEAKRDPRMPDPVYRQAGMRKPSFEETQFNVTRGDMFDILEELATLRARAERADEQLKILIEAAREVRQWMFTGCDSEEALAMMGLDLALETCGYPNTERDTEVLEQKYQKYQQLQLDRDALRARVTALEEALRQSEGERRKLVDEILEWQSWDANEHERRMEEALNYGKETE